MRLKVIVAVSLVILGSGCGATGASPVRSAAPGLKAGGVRLVYRALSGASGQPPRTATIQRAVSVMLRRLHYLGLAGSVTAHGDTVTVAAPIGGNDGSVGIADTGELFFYDWEANVIGPAGRAAPRDRHVTGGVNAGSPSFGLTYFDAVRRASARPTPRRTSRTTSGTYYLVDNRSRTVLAGPVYRRADLFSARRPTVGARVSKVRPGTVVVHAEPLSRPGGPARYYVLNDRPALNQTDIRDPRQAFSTDAGGNGEPVLTFNFTGRGRRAFKDLSRHLADRGKRFAPPGTRGDKLQHFAIVLDHKLISAPFIDFNQYPNGIDAANGSQIQGGFTLAGARTLATLLETSALPITLTLVARTVSRNR